MLDYLPICTRSNNTNKFSPQELRVIMYLYFMVQIIQINLVLKNKFYYDFLEYYVQIIQINLVLKNLCSYQLLHQLVQIIQINLVLKNN